MKKVLFERVLIKHKEKKRENMSILDQLTNEVVVQVEVLDWGTDRDGNPFKNFSNTAYMSIDARGIPVSKEDASIMVIDRRFIVGY